MPASCLAAFGLEKNYLLQKMHQFSRLQTKESESLVVINETPSPQSAPPPRTPWLDASLQMAWPR